MRQRFGDVFDEDQQFTDLLREVNELRRSRSLPEYDPTTTYRLHPRRPSRLSAGSCWDRFFRR